MDATSTGTGKPRLRFSEEALTRSRAPRPTFRDLINRNPLAFDKGWYENQCGLTFDTENLAVKDAAGKIKSHGYSVHPLHEPSWFKKALEYRNPRIDPGFHLLFLPGRPIADPHPLVNLELLATHYPVALQHGEGVFGWLLQALAADPTFVLPVDGGSATRDGWHLVRQSLARGLEDWRQSITRLKQWEAARASTTFDHDAAGRLTSVGEPAESAPSSLVSVIMPSYNRVGMMTRAIQSVQAQTWVHWELIVVDDGSLDGTVPLVRKLAAADPRIRLVSRPHRGVSAARNTGITEASGRWVAFLDTDNTWNPDYLKTMVAELGARDAAHGYAALAVDDEQAGVSYRTSAPEDSLDLGNFIDLNIWMVEREFLSGVGGFDETLKRSVDYDLIWRAAKKAAPVYVPLIGATYDTGSVGADRLTDLEGHGWKDRVRSRHLIAWDQLRTEQPTRPDGVSAVVLWSRETPQQLSATIRSLGRDDSGVDEVIVVGSKLDRFASTVVTSERQLSHKVHDLMTLPNAPVSLLANVAASATTFQQILFTRAGAVWGAGDASVLADGLTSTVGAVQPVLLRTDQEISAAGHFFPRAPHGSRTIDPADVPLRSALPGLPVPFLTGHNISDLASLPAHYEADGALIDALMVRAGDFLAVDGFDSLYGQRWFDIDFCRRLKTERDLSTRVCKSVTVRHHRASYENQGRNLLGAAQLLRSARPTEADAAADPWLHTGFQRIGWKRPVLSAMADFGEPAAPLLVRGPRDPMRVAIKHCAPPGADGRQWGDPYFARQVADAFVGLGIFASIDDLQSALRASTDLDDVNVMIRGASYHPPLPGALNVLWVISRPENIKADELTGFDLVFAASEQWAQRARAYFGIQVEVLLQGAGISLPEPSPDLGLTDEKTSDALFVGNSRWDYLRPAVSGLSLASQTHDVAVYGSGWGREAVNQEMIRGSHVNNDELGAHYAATRVVVNDHHPTMRENGFINNRIFDALAVGTPVISDRIRGAEDIFGDRVLWYDSPEEIPDLIESAKTNPWSMEKRTAVREWIRTHHSFDVRIGTMMNRVNELW